MEDNNRYDSFSVTLRSKRRHRSTRSISSLMTAFELMHLKMLSVPDDPGWEQADTCQFTVLMASEDSR